MNSSGLMGSLGIVGKTFGKFGEFWKRQESGRKRLFVVLGVTGILLAAALVWLLNMTPYTVLYANLSASDAGEILSQLEEMGVAAKPQGDDTILVPKDQVDQVRMQLAASGYPKSSTSLDILQQGSGFGVTEEDKAIYRRYQLQQDLQNAIKTFASVADARVSLNIPETSSFIIEDQQTEATAAVLLTLKPGASLTAGNIQAISQLVQKSVPGLQAEGVSIIDNEMNVLNADSSSSEMLSTDQQSLEQQVSDRLKKQVMALLQPIFGVDKVLAEVNVDLNFDDSVVDSVRFEPMTDSSNGIIASIDKIREVANGSSSSKTASGQAGTATNGSAVTTYPVVGVDDSVYEKNSEKINYEINTIKEHLVKAKGTVSQLSVSVVLDSQDAAAADYSENVKNLVATAVGVSQDYITVEKLPFKGVANQSSTWEEYNTVNAKALQWDRTRFFILLGIGLLLALLVIILLVKAIKGPGRSKEDEIDEIFPSLRAERPDLQAAYASAGLTASAGGGLNLPVSVADVEAALALEMDPANIARKTVESYIISNPELAASIVRTWLAEDKR